MKRVRERLKARKKNRALHNAQFKKLTRGFFQSHKGQVDRNKSRQPNDVAKAAS
jgi:hypothetical protein